MLADRVMIDACVGGGGVPVQGEGVGVTMDACVGGEGVMDAGQGDD